MISNLQLGRCHMRQKMQCVPSLLAHLALRCKTQGRLDMNNGRNTRHCRHQAASVLPLI